MLNIFAEFILHKKLRSSSTHSRVILFTFRHTHRQINRQVGVHYNYDDESQIELSKNITIIIKKQKTITCP